MALRIRRDLLISVVRKTSSSVFPNHSVHTKPHLSANILQTQQTKHIVAGKFKPDDLPSRFINCSSALSRDGNRWGPAATELTGRRVDTDQRSYYIDLKREAGKDGKLFVKLSEKSNGKRSTILIDFEDLHNFANYMKEALTKEPHSEAYAMIDSKMFQHKVHDFILLYNDYGRYLEMRESYTKGIRDGRACKIFVDENHLPAVTEALQSVMIEGQSQEFSGPSILINKNDLS